MKKIFALIAMLITAASCTPTENSNKVATTNTNAADTKPAAPPMTEASAIEMEKATWDMFKKRDYDGFGGMLTSDNLYVGADGVFDKEANLKSAREYELIEAAFSDWKYLPIGNNAFVVTYTVTAKGKTGGKEQPAQTVRASSGWVKQDGKWLSNYHQETEVKKPGTPPPAKPAPSPAAGAPTTIATTADAEANEKAVWDALKAHNAEAFASALDPAAIEVEAEGVFDKAGSVKTVALFDFSKATLSEFKTLKFNGDGTLVTYLVKGVGENGERHTTIWVNRSGKWLALFHHGSPVTAGPPPPPAKASPSAPAAQK
jgi:hypothetical protein